MNKGEFLDRAPQTTLTFTPAPIVSLTRAAAPPVAARRSLQSRVSSLRHCARSIIKKEVNRRRQRGTVYKYNGQRERERDKLQAEFTHACRRKPLSRVNLHHWIRLPALSLLPAKPHFTYHFHPCNIGYSPSMVGWTEIGHQIQSLSKVCQNIVQCLSKDQKSTRSVQSSTGSVKCLSRVCRVSVQSKSSWTEFRHGNAGFVQ